MNPRSTRNYAFHELRRHAARVEWCAKHAADRRAAIRGLGTLEFWEGKAHESAEQARKIACEYSAFIAKGSYV